MQHKIEQKILLHALKQSLLVKSALCSSLLVAPFLMVLNTLLSPLELIVTV